jgi:hypothetical protein
MTVANADILHNDLDDTPNPAAIALDKLRYYDFRRHWTKRITPHLRDKMLNAILVRDFNRLAHLPQLGQNLTDFQVLFRRNS